MTTGDTQVIDTAQQSNEEQARKAAQAIWDELEAEDSGSAGEPPPAADAQPAPSTTEPQAGQPPAADAPPQKIAGSPLSDEERALLRQIPEVVQLVKSTVGRVGSLQSELAKLGKQAADNVAGAAPTAGQIDKAAASPEKWETLKKDFPDWAEGVEAYVKTRIPSVSPVSPVDPSAIRQQIAGEFEAKRQEDAMEVVSLFDPKWREKAASPEFKAWLDAQPPEFRQQALSTWRPSEILSTVRAFDASRQPAAKPAPNPRLRGATIPTGSTRVNLTKPVDEMTPQEYWAYLDAQEAKQARA